MSPYPLKNCCLGNNSSDNLVWILENQKQRQCEEKEDSRFRGLEAGSLGESSPLALSTGC